MVRLAVVRFQTLSLRVNRGDLQAQGPWNFRDQEFFGQLQWGNAR